MQLLPIFIVSAAGHVFSLRYLSTNHLLLTNEYGCQTAVDSRYAMQLLGVSLRLVN